MTVATQLLIADFKTADGAKIALNALRDADIASDFFQQRSDIAILAKDEDGKIKFKESHGQYLGGAVKRSAAAGLIGGLLGVITGPVIGIGTAVGAIYWDKLVDTGFPNEKLKEMAESLQPNHSLIVVLTDTESAPAVERILAEASGELISHPLSADLVSDLQTAVEAGESQTQAGASE